jgi:4-amino-4-deoxy-L-arabinose transferase-like glycosyltransferase
MKRKAETDTAAPGGNAAGPLLVAVAIALVVAAWYARMLPLGAISHYDEFFTLARSSGFAFQDDWWNVYTFNEITFRKPPLQYWMSAGLLELGASQNVALRLPSFLFSIAVLFATGLLAWALRPGSLWIVPIAVLLVASSQFFWRIGVSGLLDAGGQLFVVLALAGTILALERPRWWYLVAVSIGLGALHKAPTALIFVALFLGFLALTAPLNGYAIGRVVRQREFWVSTLIAVALAGSWYAWQFVQHGLPALQEMIGWEMVGRFSPTPDFETQRSFEQVILHITNDESKFLRGIGVLLIFALPFWLKRRELLPLPLMLVTYGFAITLAGGYVSDRYAIYLWPLFAAIVSAFVMTLRLSPLVRGGLVVLLSAANFGPFHAADRIAIYPDAGERERVAILKAFGESDLSADHRVFCHWTAPNLPAGAIAYYASGGDLHVQLYYPEQLAHLIDAGEIAGTVRGVCKTAQLPAVEAAVEDLRIVETIGDHHHWTAVAASD